MGANELVKCAAMRAARWAHEQDGTYPLLAFCGQRTPAQRPELQSHSREARSIDFFRKLPRFKCAAYFQTF